MCHPLLWWLETACSLQMNRAFQIHVIGMCGNRGDGKRNISISGTGVFTLPVGVLFGAWTQITLGWVKLKPGALESTIIKGKPAQRNKAFHFQEANQTRRPPQHITSSGWPISLRGQCHSKWQQVYLSAVSFRNRLPWSKSICFEEIFGHHKSSLLPLQPDFTSVLAQEGCHTQHLGKPAYCNGQLSCCHSWLGSLQPHLYQHFPLRLLLAPLPPLPRISWSLDQEPWGLEGEKMGTMTGLGLRAYPSV